MKAYIGIDVSKATLDACVLCGEGKPRHRKFANTQSGFDRLLAWADEQAAGCEGRFCLESTGCYGFGVAAHLADQGRPVSVENPRRIKHFAIAANLRSKTDKSDALCIARYAQVLGPKEWALKDPLKRELATMRTRLRQLDKAALAERARLEDQQLAPFVQAQIRAHLDWLAGQVAQAQAHVRGLMARCGQARAVYEAVTGVNGIGPECGLLMAGLDVEAFDEAQSVATYFGLNPRVHQSGKFCGQTRLSKHGDAAGRTTLMSAANAAARSNAHFRRFYETLRSRGLRRKQAVAAVARKLVMTAWAIARNALRGLPVTYPGGEHRGRNLQIYAPSA